MCEKSLSICSIITVVSVNADGIQVRYAWIVWKRVEVQCEGVDHVSALSSLLYSYVTRESNHD